MRERTTLCVSGGRKFYVSEVQQSCVLLGYIDRMTSIVSEEGVSNALACRKTTCISISKVLPVTPKIGQVTPKSRRARVASGPSITGITGVKTIDVFVLRKR